MILGIDPGTMRIGFALVENIPGAPRLYDSGLIPITGDSADARLAALSHGLHTLIARWKPDALAVERLFFSKNQKTALAVAEARGVILLTARETNLTLYEYTPLQVKNTITGSGAADKKQVQHIPLSHLPALFNEMEQTAQGQSRNLLGAQLPILVLFVRRYGEQVIALPNSLQL